MDTIEQLLAHRSIRKFTNEALDEALLDKILSAGQSAASSSFAQAYSVIRVTDPDLRASLTELSGSQPYINSAAEFLVCCADLARNASVCAEGKEQDEPGFIEQLIIGTVDVSLMAQNMVVAAESLGLGICYIGGIRNNISDVSNLLGLPDYVFPVFGLCLGFPAQNPEVKPRLPKSVWVMENAYKPFRQQDLDDYDAVIREYYAARTGNKKRSTWSEELRGHFSKKVRPHMLRFLNDRGLAKK